MKRSQTVSRVEIDNRSRLMLNKKKEERRKIKEKVKKYEKSYLEHPETEEEIKAFESAGAMILSTLPWGLT